jgi:ribose-phosphate pyrophosphokinase
MSTKRKPLLFWTASYAYMGEAMLKSGRFVAGKIARSTKEPFEVEAPFADGERYHRLMTDVDRREVVLIGGAIDDREFMETLDLANLMVDMGCQELKIIVPFLGYSTMERAVLPGEAVKAKVRARLLSSIPSAREGNSIYLVDLHAVGTQHYFERHVHTRHIYAKTLVVNAVNRLLIARAGLPDDCSDKAAIKAALAQPFVLASTDVGRSAWVGSLSRDLSAKGYKVSPAFIIKRHNAESTEVVDISADVKGAFVIVYDDMGRTCGSLINAGKAYRAKGAAEVAAIITHCIMPGGSKQRLIDSKAIWKLHVVDTHPRALELKDDEFLYVNSVSSLLSEKVTASRMELI